MFCIGNIKVYEGRFKKRNHYGHQLRAGNAEWSGERERG